MKKNHFIFLTIFLLFSFGHVNSIPISQENQTTLVITGILVSNNGSPLSNKDLKISLNCGNTVGKPPKICLTIVGVKGGGAIKLIDGKVSNPTVTTSNDGSFRFELTQEFIDGEETIVISSPQNNFSARVTESFPIVNKDGVPWILVIDELPMEFDMGKVKLLER